MQEAPMSAVTAQTGCRGISQSADLGGCGGVRYHAYDGCNASQPQGTPVKYDRTAVHLGALQSRGFSSQVMTESCQSELSPLHLTFPVFRLPAELSQDQPSPWAGPACHLGLGAPFPVWVTSTYPSGRGDGDPPWLLATGPEALAAPRGSGSPAPRHLGGAHHHGSSSFRP